MFKRIDGETSKIKQRIFSINATRALLMQYNEDCHDVEKEVVVLTIKCICLKVLKLFLSITFFLLMPIMVFKVIGKLKK